MSISAIIAGKEVGLQQTAFGHLAGSIGCGNNKPQIKYAEAQGTKNIYQKEYPKQERVR